MSVEFAMRIDRAAWLRTTALAGWALIACAPAMAQTLPTPNDVVTNSTNGGDPAAITNPTATTLQVDLRARNTVIEWRSFSIPAGSSANFRDARADGVAGTNPIAVLNRVVGTPAPAPSPSPFPSDPEFQFTSGFATASAGANAASGASHILGTLNSDPNVSVFLLNPNGILFGPTANVSVGALVASTLALNDTEFYSSDGFEFTGGTAAIRVDPGARIAASSTLTSGGVALIAASVDTQGAISATGDVALVSAADVNLVFQPGSPLSMTIRRGTVLNAPMVARGSIAGRNVLFAAATQSTVTESLLDIQSVVTATTATATDRGIILAAGPTSVASDRVAFVAGAATAGVIDARLGGSLSASGAAGGVTLLSGGGLDDPARTTAITAGGDVTIRAARGTTGIGSLTAGDDVSVTLPAAFLVSTLVGDDISVSAGSLAGGSAGQGTAITGSGQVRVTTAGAALLASVSGAGGVAINAGSVQASGIASSAGSVDVTAADGNLIGGAVSGAAGARLRALAGDIRTTSLTSAVSVDAVARTLDLGTIGTAAATLTAQSGSLTIAGGNVTDAVLSAATDLIVTGTLSSSETTSLIAGDAITGGSVVGTGSLSATASTIDAAELSGAAGLSTNSASLTLDRASATAGNGSLVTTDGPIAVGSGSFGTLSLASAGDVTIGTTLTTSGDATLTAAGAFNGGAVQSGGVLQVTAGTAIAADRLSGAAALTATGTAISLGIGESANGTARLTSTEGALTLGAATTGGDLILEAAGVATLSGNATVGGSLSLVAPQVTLGNAGSAIQQANGDVRITTIAGAIFGLGSLVLRANADASGGETVRLNAAGRIEFAPTSRIEIGGRDGDILLLRGNLSAPLALGGLSARQVNDGTLTNAGNIVLGGAVSLINGLTLSSTSGAVTARDVSIDAGGLTVVANGSVTTGNLLVGGSGAALTATTGDVRAGDVRVNGAGSLAITASGSIAAANLRAGAGGVALRTAAGTIGTQAIEIDGPGNLGITSAGAVTTDAIVTGGAVRIGTTAGPIATGRIAAASGAVELNAGGAGLSTGEIAARSLALRGGAVTSGALNIGDTADITATNGALTLTGGSVGNRLTLTQTGTGGVTISGVMQAGVAPGSTGAAIVNASGDVRINTLRSVGGDVSIVAGGGVGGASAGSGATLRANASTGSLSVSAGGTLTLAAFEAGRDVALTTEQALSVGGDVTLGGNLTLSGSSVALGGGSKSAAGAVAITATTGTINASPGARLIADSDGVGGGDMTLRSAGTIALGGTTLLGGPARQSSIRLALGSGAPLTLGTVSARSLVSLASGGGAAGLDLAGPVTIDSISVTDALAIGAGTQPASLTINSITSSAGGVTLASPQLRLGSVSAAGDVGIETSGSAVLDSVRAPGRNVSIGSSDLELAGAIVAGEVRLINRGTANRLRIGSAPEGNVAEFDAVAAPFYSITNAEIARIEAASLRIDARGRDMIVGDASFGAAAGSTAVSLWNSGRIDVLGRVEVTGGAPGRTLQIGGDATDTGLASIIRIAPRPSGGGRIVAEGARVSLAGGRIGVGYDRDFQELLGLAPGSTSTPTVQQVNEQLVARSNSSLYIATLAGEPPYVDTVLVRAGALAVRYADFALFQNTGLPGLTSGFDLTGLAGVPTLQIGGTAGVGQNAFAFFGAINGVSGRATSLLGADSISIDAFVDRGSARANGCLIGSAGGGCLAASLAQPQLLRVENNTEIFGSSAALTLLFDPLVGSSNESLFADIVGFDIAPQEPAAPPTAEPQCPPESEPCNEGDDR